MENNAVDKRACCTRVRGVNVLECNNNPFPITSITEGVIAKIPVVLAELTVQINLNSFIQLPEPAYEIKQIKNNLKVTQCLLLQDTDTLFIKGFIRKTVNYTTRECSNHDGFCGAIKHCTINVPFSCTTVVTFNGNPLVPVINNTSNEFQFFETSKIDAPGFARKNQLLSGDFSGFNQTSTEYYNELPYCELISSKIIEYDEFLDKRSPQDVDIPSKEKSFTKIEEKMVVYLTLELLQNQQVQVPATKDNIMVNEIYKEHSLIRERILMSCENMD